MAIEKQNISSARKPIVGNTMRRNTNPRSSSLIESIHSFAFKPQTQQGECLFLCVSAVHLSSALPIGLLAPPPFPFCLLRGQFSISADYPPISVPPFVCPNSSAAFPSSLLCVLCALCGSSSLRLGAFSCPI